MMKNRMKQGGAVLLAAALLVSAFAIPKTYAALAVKTEEKCSVEVNVSTAEYSELKTLPVNVNLYKVADIDVTGKYTGAGAFTSLDFSDVSVDPEVAAGVWVEKAKSAKALVTDAVAADAAITLANGTATAGNLETGLYLVDAKTALSDAYQYDFQPYLISLPNNYFYGTGNDDWVYNLTGNNAVGLKPERTDRYGDLVIDKTLDVFNETIGGATFVFQVEAYKKDVDKTYAEGELGEHVYSDVVSMTFNAPGKDSVTIEDIPAGAVVYVTEVYTGASYILDSEALKTATIIADAMDGAPVSVAFENTYAEELNGGNGIVNSFIYDEANGSWTHSATEDSTP